MKCLRTMQKCALEPLKMYGSKKRNLYFREIELWHINEFLSFVFNRLQPQKIHLLTKLTTRHTASSSKYLKHFIKLKIYRNFGKIIVTKISLHKKYQKATL